MSDIDQGAAFERGWCLYLLECRNGAYYAGITNDMASRFAAHLRGKGAKYTRANPPLRILGVAPFSDRVEASKAEWRIKQVPRDKKLAYLQALIEEAVTPEAVARPRPKG